MDCTSPIARAAAQFLVGTEQGKVVACNRKAKNPSDRVGTIYEGHCGPARNPFFPKYFMTVGVFATTKMDGTLDVWDYFYKQNEPALSLQAKGCIIL
ncbi:hypothetical protein EMIHUDRAFT_221996 [Emiliania huxleyi CCMP1516]|uniref:Uncharacterized protein n=2 Tax=Emiliania huxleyi TaxID=2903 RepID=A0A0D3KYZ1_EMIH1|nr:hypothetical protein EMIHUDRAFT_221996 [Emiliania huxleyi CCMP1516]EOD40976.1 hypothetical protein EMIHUDRAFT_221996 [Emiliania huxleyi CCMP1516]|eukprot:XP_005793405.1 hypothetical protein EMIHUDRAFT_221996 [Emiliania huxleyi CCMP1516]